MLCLEEMRRKEEEKRENRRGKNDCSMEWKKAVGRLEKGEILTQGRWTS